MIKMKWKHKERERQWLKEDIELTFRLQISSGARNLRLVYYTFFANEENEIFRSLI